MPTMPPLESVRGPARVAALVAHPLRLTILGAAARAPTSASEIAAGLGVPRQRVNYHLRRLERAGFLAPSGRVRRRGLYEQRYRASAEAYVLDPQVLGELGARPERVADRLSAEYLVALAAQVQRDLAQVQREAAAKKKRVATLSISAELRFTSAEQRAGFAQALERAITEVVARHSSPSESPTGEPLAGRRFRLMVACYPPPVDPLDSEEP